MQLTRFTDYSLRVLLYMALRREGESSTINEIAEHFDISRNNLIKVVQLLGKIGYLNNTRRKGGGIALGGAPEAINIGAVVRQVEVTLDPIDCAKPACPLLHHCTLKGVMNDAQEAFLGVLDRYTLADVIDEPASIQVLLGIPPSVGFAAHVGMQGG